MNIDNLLEDILQNYFYGIDFENVTIRLFKRFDNNSKDILYAYNEAEKFDTFALIKSLYIEYFILKTNLSNVKSEEEVNRLYNSFRNRNGIVFALFTNDLLKKIGRSIDVVAASKEFEKIDSAGDCLLYIYYLCRSELIEVNKETNKIDDKAMKKMLLNVYSKTLTDNFEPRSLEYDRGMKQYQRMFKLMNELSINEFLLIFKSSYTELLNDVNNRKNVNVK